MFCIRGEIPFNLLSSPIAGRMPRAKLRIAAL